jgi:RNA polymerase sigma-70 factor, ECF subfamily
MIAVVNPKRVPEPGTLGDLLYADGAALVTEQDWAQLVQAIAAGDQHALRALYERSYRIVFTLVLRICGNREAAEEVTVDVYYDVWRRAAQYEPQGGTVVGWIMMQARSRALDRVKLEQRKKRVAPREQEDPPATDGPASAIAARQRRETIDHALRELTPDERQAIETAYFSELTYSETAARLDQPIGTVKTRIRSALAKLRKALGPRGGSR